MRIIGKNMAMGLIGGILSLTPMASKAQSRVTNEARAVAQYSKKPLQSLATDTINLSKKFTKPAVKTASATFLDTFSKTLTKYGSTISSVTEKSTIYNVTKEAAQSLRLPYIDELPGNLEHIKMAIPKANKNLTVADCPVSYTFGKEYKTYADGGKANIRVILLTKGEGNPVFINVENYSLPKGKAFQKEYYVPGVDSKTGKEVKYGFSETHIVRNDGSESFEYRVLETEQTLGKAEFEENKQFMIKGFEELVPNEVSATVTETPATKVFKETITPATTPASAKPAQDDLQKQLDEALQEALRQQQNIINQMPLYY